MKSGGALPPGSLPPGSMVVLCPRGARLGGANLWYNVLLRVEGFLDPIPFSSQLYLPDAEESIAWIIGRRPSAEAFVK